MTYPNPIKTAEQHPAQKGADKNGQIMAWHFVAKCWSSVEYLVVVRFPNEYTHWLPMPTAPKDECQLEWEESGMAGKSMPEAAIWIAAWKAARKEKQ